MIRAAGCTATRGERIVRGIAAVFVSAAAFSMLDNPWAAIPAALAALFLAVVAVTGWCPGGVAPRRDAGHVDANSLGFPEARQPIDVETHRQGTGSNRP